MKPKKVGKDGLVYECDKKQSKIRPDLRGDLKNVLISPTCIRNRISALARQIVKDAARDEIDQLEAVVVLKGAAVFAGRLAQEIHKAGGPPVKFNYISASSYGKGMSSSGTVSIKDETGDLQGKEVLIIEDIVDTGNTVKKLRDFFEKHKNPSEVKLCSLLDKPSRRRKDLREKIHIDYSGFTVPDVFVAGYGIDCAGKFRELPYIAAVRPKGHK
jgi:hypoxanthine phosphoribosyltransferase